MLAKIIMGVALAAPIGPVSLEMIKRGLARGFLAAFIVRLGGALGNTLCLVAAYFGLRLFMHSKTTMTLCTLFGSIILIYLGLKAVIKTSENIQTSDLSTDYPLANGLLTGFILSLANPVAIVYWLGIFAASTSPQDTAVLNSWTGLLHNFPIIFGVLLWGMLLSGLLELGSRYFNQTIIHLITKLAGIMLLFFGMKYGYKAFLAIF